ncbi:MAG: hypothetical protein A3C02_03440 [Candidatus Andersenbacteria bacterium RIFCSPHIGHO2_02_FULL_45_11]|uniref:Uncharacterized protein n=1 Tax=Candidatus Andersenbacteria bacterium RIFCSPHIGHO2_12_FULL_45_11 TaxID=1797281 RepID=A0A1G1X646_9BACT|nr:MAG: hypothetical protein A2805_03755 [Candidatus Andersenbacteria bacterium RIFCSPHIGHO2_01_FULL_46_36]OGY33489.1 MAG: hypothetical protein A3C02_03440 [Candidatus Andersenbacteria bacterium RIFCSPHIGHO2_02_FULL_45_11]OGY34807.1 MAG: hypothetical protein A3D99_01970 [Candidatus Andersenbacteria bacterium RIFCSPHIGHO2_12_FULL_45_11]
MKEKIDCKKHKWIPLLGVDKKKSVPTSLFTCLMCGDLKVGTQTIKISRFRLDMGGLPMNSVGTIGLMNQPIDDASASGLITTATVATNKKGVGAPLFMTSIGQFKTTSANSNATSPCLALAMEKGTGIKKVLLHGILRVDAWKWKVGPGNKGLLYVDTVPGALTQKQPAKKNAIIQPVGWALSKNTIYFSPSMIYLTHA